MQKGAELRVGDIVENSVEDLEGLLVGVNILVIMVATTVVGSQENILLAASKSKDIERVVPSEFSAIHSETNPIVNSSTTFQNVSRLFSCSFPDANELTYSLHLGCILSNLKRDQ